MRIPERGPGAVMGYSFAVVIAVLVFACALGVYLHWDRPLLLGLVFGSFAGLVTAIVLTVGHNRFLWAVEEIVGDIDGDGVRGNPAQYNRKPAEPKVQYVERPFPVYGPPRSQPSTPAPVQPPQTDDRPLFKAPSGRFVTWDELVDFANRAPVRGTSFTSYWREVYELAGYDDPHEHWQDVVDLWAIFGCCSERKERHTVKWKADTHEQAMLALGTANAANRRPPHPTGG